MVRTACTAFLALLLLPEGIRAKTSPGNPQELAAVYSSHPSAHELIQRAFAAGRLSPDRWALYQAYALFDRQKLPAEFQSNGFEKCATWIFAGFRRVWNQLSPEIRHALAAYGFSTNGALSRPGGLNELRTTTHFAIHYSVQPGDANAVPTVDADANGTPDYIDSTMRIVENVYSYEIDTLGYTPPPPDGIAGGSALYDVYVFKLAKGIYGYEQPENDIGDNPISPNVVERYAATSYLALRNDYTGFPTATIPALQVTSAHEFFHAIQAGYNNYEQEWLMESTATWIEDEVYDSVNDNLGYLPEWFAQPYLPLDASNYTADTLVSYSGHWYGSWIFFRYLSEHLPRQASTVQRIWDHSVEHDSRTGDFSFVCLTEALQEQSTTFQEVFSAFAVANLMRTEGPYTYREGNLYPVMIPYELARDTSVNFAAYRHACRYFRILPPTLPTACRDILKIVTNPQDPALHSGYLCVRMQSGYPSIMAIGNSLTVRQGDADSLYLIVLNLDSTGTRPVYNVNIQHTVRTGDYRVTDIGVVNSVGFSLRLNSRGDVAGTWTATGGGSPSAFLWSNGNMRYLGGSAATALNDSGDVAGWIPVPGPNGRNAYLWGNGWAKDLDTTTGEFSGAYGINDSGFVVGARQVNAGFSIAILPVLWSNGTAHQLPLLPPDSLSTGGIAFAINRKGQIAGEVTTRNPLNPGFAGPVHGVLWQGGGPIDLGEAYVPVAINDSGFSVGSRPVLVNFGTYSVTQSHASRDGADLGTIDGAPGVSTADGINSSGEIVGMSTTTSTNGSAFLYRNGVMVDLNDVTDDLSCWALLRAGDINDSGQIVAYAINPDEPTRPLHAVLLTPTGTTSVTVENQSVPAAFRLEQNFPNPFNPTTGIRYEVPRHGAVRLAVYDILGRQVAVLVDEEKEPGTYEAKFDATRLASGVYLYRLSMGSLSQTRKMLVLR